MLFQSVCKLSKLLSFVKSFTITSVRRCQSVFGIQDLLHQEKAPEHFALFPLTSEYHDMAIEALKQHYLSDHVLVRTRNMDLTNDRAIDEYITNLLRQGNSLFAKTEDDAVAGICINCASSPVDPKNLRNFAFYRQDPNTKDFLYFTAKLQETPNLWQVFKQQVIFEIRMLAVVPEYRRQGVAVSLVEKSKQQAYDLGHNVIRMDCINPYDYKIAERCMLQCLAKYPLSKLRGATGPFVRSGAHGGHVRVYVETRAQPDVDRAAMRTRKALIETLIE